VRRARFPQRMNPYFKKVLGDILHACLCSIIMVKSLLLEQ
jgi:hypothetical protein